ncbi:UNVERIFIED_CONTAM: hypothetical protein FKN15_039447 [Acipenser sinensis]
MNAKQTFSFFTQALVGEKYGSTQIPGEVESSEFEMILDAAVEAKLDTRILEEWYCRDENAVPPAYYLKSKSEMLKNYHNALWVGCMAGLQSEKKHSEDSVWRTVCVRLRRFRVSAAIENELDFALGKQMPAFLKNCVCYIRKIANFDRHAKLPEMGRYMDTIVENDKVVRNQEAHERLIKLRDEFIPTVVASSNFRVYTSVTHCDMKLGYSQEVESHYVEGLCKQFYEDMVDIIQAAVQQNFDTETDPLYDEVLQHLSLCKTYASFYEHRCEALNMIHKYILPSKTGRMNPLIVYGGPCTGKTLLLAEVAKQAYAWLQQEMGQDTDPVVIVRFLGSTEVGSELRSVLQNICKQIAINYRCLVHSNPHKIHDLKELLINLMNESSFHRPLVIILDAVEQLSDSDEARKLWWLPINLPRSVRIVVSTLPNKHGILQKMRCLIHDEDNYVELMQRDRKMCSQILKHQLLKVKRKVTSGQQIYVNEALAKCTLPMFVNLIFREVMHWRSHKDVDDSSLCVTVHESIEQLFWSLENKLGSRFVVRALGYITMAKTGLSEMELEDILSLDNSVLSEIIVSTNLQNPLRISYILIAKLKEELNGYLVERQVRNVTLLVWANRHLQLIAQKLYLSNEEDVHQMHSLLAEYFLGVWSGGRRKIFHCESNHFGSLDKNQMNLNHCEKPSVEESSFDRQTPEQPWVFQCNSLEPDIFFVNHRKMTELLHHLTRSGRTDDLMFGVIMNFSWLYTMIKIGQFNRALSDIDVAYNYSQEKELKFLASTLRSIKLKVMKNPSSLSAELQQRLLPVVTSLPKLRHLLLECDKDGPKYCSIVPLHSSMDVTYSPERLPLCLSYMQIVEVLPTFSPGIVIAALENGSISTWDVETHQLLRQIDTAHSVVLGIKLTSDEKYLVVATTKNTLLVYDNHKSCLLSEVEIKGSKHCGVGGGVAFINGFTLSSNHALAWLEASKDVNVIDLLFGWPLYQFHCWYEVTCVQCSPDGVYAFCGQYLNTTTIFNLGSGEKLSTVTSEFSGGFVKSILILDTLQEMVMIDNEGNLSVWNTEEVTNPQIIEDFDCRGEDNEVVSIELSEDQRAILICKARSIEVLDTDLWKMAEKFKAKRNERFVSAVLTKTAECIVASMENTSAIFVWRRDSGQCMASLEEVSGSIVKLIKSNHHNLLLSLTTSGVVSIWDIDIITAMSNIDKTGKPIHNLLLPGRGELIYTLDRSEAVHKWNFSTGFIETVFKHEGIVENCVLTSSGDLMVTSDDKCSQYVWHTATGDCVAVKLNMQHQDCCKLAPAVTFPRAREKGYTRLGVHLTGGGGSYVFDSAVPVEVYGWRSDGSSSVYSQEKPVGTDNCITGQTVNKQDFNNQQTLAQKQRVSNIENDKNQVNRTYLPPGDEKYGLGENKGGLQVETNGLCILENERTQRKCTMPSNEGGSDTSSSLLSKPLVDNYIAAPSQNNSSVVKGCEEQSEATTIQATPKTENILVSNGNQDKKQPSLLNDSQPEVNPPAIQTHDSFENDYVDVTDNAPVNGVDAKITILSNASISSADIKECVSQLNDLDELNGRISPLVRGELDSKSEERKSSIDNFEICDDLEVAEALAALEAATAGEDEE